MSSLEDLLLSFLKNLFLYSCATSRQNEYLIMMNKVVSTKIINFMTPGAGVPVIVCDPIWSYSENALIQSLKIFFFTAVHLADSEFIVLMSKEASAKMYIS